MNKKITCPFIFCAVLLLWLSFQPAAQAHSDCIETLAPVTTFLQQHDESADWQYFVANKEHFATLEAILHPQHLRQVLEVLDINNEGALFMRMESQSLWIFKIEQCMYSLLADLKGAEQLGLQLTLHAEQSLPILSGPAVWFDFPMLHHFSDHQSGEEFYAFQWLQTNEAQFESVLKKELLTTTTQISSCWQYQLCAFEHAKQHYLFSWVILGKQHIMLLFKQPCAGECDVGF